MVNGVQRGLVSAMDARERSNRPLLELNSLRKSVPGVKLLFDGVNLSVGAGEFVTIKGQSAVGKSTLLNMSPGLDLADAGTIAIHVTVLDGLDYDARTRLRRDNT